jgi:hypothetical protein
MKTEPVSIHTRKTDKPVSKTKPAFRQRFGKADNQQAGNLPDTCLRTGKKQKESMQAV